MYNHIQLLYICFLFQQFSYLYFVAFAGIFLGLIIYNWKPTPVSPRRTRKAKEDISHLGNDSRAIPNEKQKLCDEQDKVGVYHFSKEKTSGLNGIISTQV